MSENTEGTETTDISVVIPVYKGADYLESLAHELAILRERWDTPDSRLRLSEAIFVDDGAVDDSPAILATLANTHHWSRVVHLSRNFGQHPATIAGILHSSGDWVVTIDEDLQHHPKHIEALLRRVIEGGLDVVYAKPAHPVHESLLRDAGTRAYKRLIAFLTGNKHVVDFNSFRLIRGNIARAAASVCAHDTYFDIALSWFTRRVGVVELVLKDHRVISGAASGYGLKSLFSHARRMIVSAQTKWLRAGSAIGIFSMFASAALVLFIVLYYLMFPRDFRVPGWASLFVAIFFFGGLILSLLGIALEYIAVILLHIQGKPTYFLVDRSKDRLLVAHFAGR